MHGEKVTSHAQLIVVNSSKQYISEFCKGSLQRAIGSITIVLSHLVTDSDFTEMYFNANLGDLRDSSRRVR